MTGKVVGLRKGCVAKRLYGKGTQHVAGAEEAEAECALVESRQSVQQSLAQ